MLNPLSCRRVKAEGDRSPIMENATQQRRGERFVLDALRDALRHAALDAVLGRLPARALEPTQPMEPLQRCQQPGRMPSAHREQSGG